MTFRVLALPPVPGFATRMARSLVRPRGSLEWDASIRGTGVMALAAIPAMLWLPGAADLVVFVLATIWCHGPLSPLLPATFEPILILFGRLYHPLFIAVVGTTASLYVEYFNYRLYGGVLRLAALERMSHAVERGRLMQWFERSPSFAVWFGTVSPIPDWLVRIVASVASYPPKRYLLAFGLGRFPRFVLFASLGTWVSLDTRLIVLVTAASIVLIGSMALFRWLRFRRASGIAPIRNGGASC